MTDRCNSEGKSSAKRQRLQNRVRTWRNHVVLLHIDTHARENEWILPLYRSVELIVPPERIHFPIGF